MTTAYTIILLVFIGKTNLEVSGADTTYGLYLDGVTVKKI